MKVKIKRFVTPFGGFPPATGTTIALFTDGNEFLDCFNPVTNEVEVDYIGKYLGAEYYNDDYQTFHDLEEHGEAVFGIQTPRGIRVYGNVIAVIDE